MTPDKQPETAPQTAAEAAVPALKDLAEHIRTVHFALLVLSLVMLAAATQQHPQRFDHARRDLINIVDLVRELPRIIGDVKEEARVKALESAKERGQPLQMGAPIKLTSGPRAGTRCTGN